MNTINPSLNYNPKKIAQGTAALLKFHGLNKEITDIYVFRKKIEYLSTLKGGITKIEFGMMFGFLEAMYSQDFDFLKALFENCSNNDRKNTLYVSMKQIVLDHGKKGMREQLYYLWKNRPNQKQHHIELLHGDIYEPSPVDIRNYEEKGNIGAVKQGTKNGLGDILNTQ